MAQARMCSSRAERAVATRLSQVGSAPNTGLGECVLMVLTESHSTGRRTGFGCPVRLLRLVLAQNAGRWLYKVN